MKKIIFCFLMLFSLFSFNKIDVLALVDENVGGNYGNISFGSCAKGNACWVSVGDKAVRGFRLSLYKYENNSVTKVGASKDFISRKDAESGLKKGTNFTYIKEHAGKVDYIQSNNKYTLVMDSNLSNISGHIYYLEDEDLQDFFGTGDYKNYNEDKDIDKGITVAIVNKNFEEINNAGFKYFADILNANSKNIKKYYLVLEPLTVIAYKNSNKTIYFYGTAYEHAMMLKIKGWSDSGVNNVSRYALQVAAAVTNVVESNGSNFGGFLKTSFNSNNFLAKLDQGIASYSQAHGNPRYKLDFLLTKSFGMQVFWGNAVYPPEYEEDDDNPPVPPIDDPDPLKEVKCNTIVKTGNCVNYFISETSKKECVVNNDNYKVTSITDCGVVYCSQVIKTILFDTGESDGFFSTFDNPIKSGSYFKMNNIRVKVEKTCYLKKYDNSNNNSCRNWEKNINLSKYNAGTIDLSFAENDNSEGNIYTLIEDKNKSKVNSVCYESKQFVCEEAKIIQDIQYGLSPWVNRFISIKDMAATATSPGSNVIDLGGPHLTTPISLATKIPDEDRDIKKHAYFLDFNNSILAATINRVNNADNTEKVIGNTKYIYSSNQPLPLYVNDLYQVCSYTVVNANEKCPPDQCCEGNEIVECECVCESITGCDEDCNPNPPECDCPGSNCDENCNVVNPFCDPKEESCGFPSVVYRPINLKEAFPGQNGLGRDFGSNWYGYVYDSNGNPITKPYGQPYTKEEYYINYNRGYNDYDIYQSSPLYVIKLDYETIKYIRDYNDELKGNYNNFDLTCTEGEKCISNFLRGTVTDDKLKGTYNRNLITSGECKDSSTFDTCITRLGA